MDYGLSIKLKQTNEQTFFKDLYEKLWNALAKNTKHYATTKASRDITNYYLQECFSTSFYEEEEAFFHYFFPESAGCTSTSAAVCMHWITLSLGQLYSGINKQMDKLGYVFDSDVSNLESYTSDTRFIEIDNKMCQLYAEDELLTDDGTVDLATLSKEDRARLQDMIETGLCQCPMCLGIRDGKEPANFRITKPRKPKKPIYEDLEKALRYPDHVKELSIYMDNYHPLTSEIEKFTAIEYLSIYDPSLNYIPEEIGALKTLTHLSITTEKLQHLPKEIGNLVNLKELYLDLENIVLPESIGQLTNLEILDLKHYENKGLPESYGQLVNLEKLALSYGQEKKCPEFIYNYKNLEEFNYYSLQHPQPVEDLDCSYLPNLKVLYLNARSLTQFPKNLQALKQLKILHVGGYQSSLKIPDELYELRELRELSLTSDEKIEFSDKIGNLTNLEELNLAYCKKDIKLPETLGKCKNLLHIRLDYSGIEALPQSIGQLSKLEVLDLGVCEHLHALPDTLANCKNLKKLLLCDSSVKQLPDTMKDCHSLKRVSVTKKTEQAKNILRQCDEWGLDVEVKQCGY